MNGWKQYTIQQTMPMGRTGWLGVWDSLVSAVTGKPRLITDQPVTLSFWARKSDTVAFHTVQLELGEKHEQQPNT